MSVIPRYNLAGNQNTAAGLEGSLPMTSLLRVSWDTTIRMCSIIPTSPNVEY